LTRRSNKHIYAQIIDDDKHHIIASAASVEPAFKDLGLSCETAKTIGATAAERAKAKGVELVFFDRNGYKYHGRVAALADGAREAGLVF
jgi:large subunit ribosomal protein L18